MRVGRTDAIEIISEKTKLTEMSIKNILREYTEYVRERTRMGVSVGIFRICYLVMDGYDGPIETFAYVCTEISRILNLSPEVVKGVLFYYEDMIIRDLKKAETHNLYSLISLKMYDAGDNQIKVKVIKSPSINCPVTCRLRVSKSFKRKVDRVNK